MSHHAMLTSWMLLCLLQLPADSESGGLDGGLLAQAAVPPPLAMRRQLAIDPSFEVRGLRISPYNVTKEPASPLIAPSEPWEVTLGYTSVVYHHCGTVEMRGEDDPVQGAPSAAAPATRTGRWLHCAPRLHRIE